MASMVASSIFNRVGAGFQTRRRMPVAKEKVVPISAAKGKKPRVPGKAMKESERIWGKDVMAQRFVIVPKLLLRAQARLGLDAIQLNVLLHLVEHWWHAERLPYPSKRTIAARMRINPRTVQRAMEAMETNGLVRRISRQSARNNGRASNAHDLSGLVAKLNALAPEFKKEAEAAAGRRRDVEKPGRRAAAATTE